MEEEIFYLIKKKGYHGHFVLLYHFVQLVHYNIYDLIVVLSIYCCLKYLLLS